MYPSLTSFSGDLFAEFDAIQRQIDRLLGFDDSPSSIRAVARGAFPALNMGTTDEAVEIYAFAPGLDPAKLEVSVDKNLLTIAGERTSELAEGSDKYDIYSNERFAGSFKRVVTLPAEVDTTRIEASYRNGVLEIRIPRSEVKKLRKIEVKELEYKH